jgi:hypothetical protein
MYTIEKDVPVPEDIKRESKYPFAAMSVNDSFAVPKHLAGTVRAASAYYRRRYSMKFVMRTDDKLPDMVRVWRIA